MRGIWVVTGRTESGDNWELQFIGEKPTRERINYIYAGEYPEEWAYFPEANIEEIIEVDLRGYLSEGAELKCGYSLTGEKIE